MSKGSSSRLGAPAYNRYSGLMEAARNLYFDKVIQQFIAPGARVLDIGAGQGDFLKRCGRLGRAAVGVDKDENWVAMCVNQDLKVCQGSIYQLPFESGSFDAVFAQSVVEHLLEPLVALREIRRVARPGGNLILSVPTPGATFWDDPTHVRPHTPRSMRTLCEMAGLRVAYLSYVFSFLLGIQLHAPAVYRMLNLLSVPLGTNLLVVAVTELPC